MKELIKTLLGDIIRKIAPDFKEEILVEIPENKENGDYTASIAFKLAKVFHKSPQATAEELAKKIKSSTFTKVSADKKEFSKIEAKNGFINFFLSKDCLKHQLGEILKKKSKYGFSKMGQSRKIQVEIISANPTGPLTVGNGRGGFYGDVLANILKTQGYIITRFYYINDRGEQVLNLGRSIKREHGEKISDENIYKGDYIGDLAKQVDKKLNAHEAGETAVKLILKNYIKSTLEKLKIGVDEWFSEKSLYKGELYQKVFSALVANELIYEKDGATWMKTSKIGDNEDRVLIKNDGAETYFMSDILFHFYKLEESKLDKSIDIWGADHHGYAPRVKAALKALGINEEKLDVVIIQFVRLVSGSKEVKISKRAGTFVTLDDLVNEVGLDAARFFFLMYSPNTHMDFDMKLAKERSAKNPVYYVQYAHARISSILAKIKNQKSKIKIIPLRGISRRETNQNLKLLNTESEFSLIRKLVEYPEILNDASKNYEVHRLPRYALELAREFHNFYEKERVISEDKKLTSARLALVVATKIVLASTLNLMGVKAPDKM